VSYFDGSQWHTYSNVDTAALAFGIRLNNQCSPEDTVGTVWTGANGKGLTESSLPAPGPVVISSTVTGVPPKLVPRQLFTPTVTVTLAQGYRLTQSDFIQSTDDNSYSSNPLIGLPPGINVQGGTPYTFSFAGNPMKAPDEQKAITSTWRVWQCGRYLDPPIKIQFTVSSP